MTVTEPQTMPAKYGPLNSTISDLSNGAKAKTGKNPAGTIKTEASLFACASSRAEVLKMSAILDNNLPTYS